MNESPYRIPGEAPRYQRARPHPFFFAMYLITSIMVLSFALSGYMTARDLSEAVRSLHVDQMAPLSPAQLDLEPRPLASPTSTVAPGTVCAPPNDTTEPHPNRRGAWVEEDNGEWSTSSDGHTTWAFPPQFPCRETQEFGYRQRNGTWAYRIRCERP